MEPGRIFGKAYRVERALGAGGVGAVFEVTQIRTGRRYALKMLLPDMALHHGARERFQREAEVLASMGHAGIVQIHDFDAEDDGTQFLVMDLLGGEDLATRIAREGALDLPAAMRLIEEVGSALSAAHARGIVHRDLKPANIFLAQREGAPERAMLLDFGLAKHVRDSVHLTATGVGVGTPLYMSPEQARGVDVDARTDIYALGSILYEMLVGEAPFIGPSLTAVLAMILTEPPPRLSEHAKRATPRLLDEVIATALAKAPEARYPTVQAFLDAARRAAGNSSDRALAATALPMPSEPRVPLTRQDVSLPSVELIAPGPLSTIRPQATSQASAQGQAISGDAVSVPQARNAPVLWLALGGMTTMTLVLGGVLLHAALTPASTPAFVARETITQSEPVHQPAEREAPTEDPLPAAPVAAPVEAPSPRRNPQAQRARLQASPEPPAPPSSPPAPANPGQRASLAEQARSLLEQVSPEQREAFRAQATASARSYDVQIANNERRIQQWEALIRDALELRQDARRIAARQAPLSCSSPLRQRLEANVREDEAMVSSTSRNLEELLDTVCTRFDDWAAPPSEYLLRFQRIGPTLDGAESSVQQAPRDTPPEARATVRDALVAFRRVHEAQPASFANYPCGHPTIAELARAGEVDHPVCAAAANRVHRSVSAACAAVQMSDENLAQQARTLVTRTEAAESNLRAAIRAYQDMNESLRAGIAHQQVIAQ